MSEKGNKAVNEISKKASECPVTKVTVYKDRAEVCRQLETAVVAGVNELHIKEFVSIEEDSIRVEGQGNATIAEVSYQHKFVAEDEATTTDKVKKLKDELRHLEDLKKTLDFDAKLAALIKQWSILDNFAATAAKHGQGEDSEDKKNFKLDNGYFTGMREFLQQYKDIGIQLEAERLDLENKNEDLTKKIETVERNLQEASICYGGHENRECVVVLEAEKETTVQLTVTYVVWGASWSPVYDLRMLTEQGDLKIFYYGLIRQNSGEDWNDVKLFLSTAEPSVGGTIPTLPATQLAVKKIREKAKRVVKAKHLTFGAQRSEVNTDRACADIIADEVYDDGVPQCVMYSAPIPVPIMPVPEVQVTESTTSTTYEIARLSTVPSDYTEHKVTVAIIDLKPTLTYVTVPKVVPHAFLQAKVINTSQYTLLSGRTNIFLDNSFVAKAEINSVAPKEEFECSLGVDPGLRVDYKPVVKVNSSSGIISKTQCITHEQAIEIKNIHDYNVKVLIRDNLPRSLDEKIKVNLISPFIDAKHPEKTESVRLAKNNNVEWDLEIKGLDKVEVVLKYTVEHPAAEEIEATTSIGN
uniref:DUF4139 domain-containing protein n=2 Tax=Arion vulgaris TaxID=1028688 RepID=A0A0B7AAG8_9EUPU